MEPPKRRPPQGRMDPPTLQPPQKTSTRSNTRCCRCDKLIRKTGAGRKAFKSEEEARIFSETYNYSIRSDQILCCKCWKKLRNIRFRISRNNVNQADQSEPSSQSPSLPSVSNSQSSDQFNAESGSSQATSQESQGSVYTPGEPINERELMNMPFDRTVASHAYCFLCKSKDNLIDVPFEARIQVFVRRRLFVPRRNRCCSTHLIKNQFYEDEISKLVVFSHESQIDVEEINKFLDKLSDDVDADVHGKIGSHKMSNARIKALTGHSWDSIDKLTELLKKMRSSQNRDLTQAIVMFLIKLRSGSSDAFIAAILDLPEYVVNSSINSILESFRKHVLPKHFGVQNYSREFLLTQQAPIVDLLYGHTDDCLYLVCDGTYLRHEKSANNPYQKKSFSGQKKDHLCKPFTIATTNGFTIDVEGPFEANLNDAKILRHLLEDPHGLITILKKGDVFVLDRGFRDVQIFLEEKGFKVLMPALKGNRKQLTTQESNESRFVTKIRWVVEAVHGILSQKCELLHEMRNKLLPNAGTYCKIACFIYNLTAKRLNCDDQNLADIVQKMKSRKQVENDLATMVSENNFGRKTKPFKSGSSEDFNDFPELTVDDLKLFFTGTYQLKQAISYLGDMLDCDEQLPINYLVEQKGILKVEIRSRHISSKTYKSFVQYQPNATGIGAIKGYCCDCANGLRTVGCCSHVAAIVYYLSYGRFLSKTIRPAENLTHLFKVDNIIPVIEEDSDED